MEYSLFLFKASHLTTLVDYLLIFWILVDVEDTYVTLLAMILLIMFFAISYCCTLTHGIGLTFVCFGDQIFE